MFALFEIVNYLELRYNNFVSLRVILFKITTRNLFEDVTPHRATARLYSWINIIILLVGLCPLVQTNISIHAQSVV